MDVNQEEASVRQQAPVKSATSKFQVRFLARPQSSILEQLGLRAPLGPSPPHLARLLPAGLPTLALPVGLVPTLLLLGLRSIAHTHAWQ